MTDLKDTKANYQGLNSAVLDVLQRNQDLYKQDLENQFAKYMIAPEAEAPNPTEAEMDAVTQANVVDSPDPIAEPEDINPDDVIDGASGMSNESSVSDIG